MPIIKYTLVNGQTPLGMTDPGYWQHTTDNTYIGVGSGVGTELSITQLKTYVKSVFSNSGFKWSENNPDKPNSGTYSERDFTDSEIETIVDDWCTARGIS